MERRGGVVEGEGEDEESLLSHMCRWLIDK